jgi:hypothetical protein
VLVSRGRYRVLKSVSSIGGGRGAAGGVIATGAGSAAVAVAVPPDAVAVAAAGASSPNSS